MSIPTCSCVCTIIALTISDNEQVMNAYTEMYRKGGELELPGWNEYDARLDRILELINSMPGQTRLVLE